MENNTTKSNSVNFEQQKGKVQPKKMNTTQILDAMQSNYNFVYSQTENTNSAVPTPPINDNQPLFPQGLINSLTNGQSQVNTQNVEQNNQNMSGNFSNMMPLLNMFLNKGGGGLGGIESLLKASGGGSPLSPLLNTGNPMMGQLLTLLPTLLKGKKTRPTTSTQSTAESKQIDNMVKANEFKVK